MIWRLQKYLARCGIASRRKCEALITSGSVKVNGAVVTTLGTKVDTEKDRVTVSGRLVRPSPQKTYIMLNKPPGYVVSRSDELGRKTIFALLPDASRDIFPVGRLDRDSEGLLLLTNDGEFAYRLAHPKFQIEKEYVVTVKGEPAERALRRLERGVLIGERLSAPARVSIIKTNHSHTTLSVSIHEGRKRQVRLMLAALGYPVERLVRVRIGHLRLGELPPGKYRPLKAGELSSLKSALGFA
jgi:23S rRNA pseudouridine2605 synthase